MSKNDKLTRLADLIDDELIEEAINCGKKALFSSSRKSRFSLTALIAACILISALLAVFSVSYIYRQVGLPSETTSPEHTDPFTLIPSPPDGEIIDTLDKLNYYGGIMSIMQSNSENSFAYLPRPTSSISLLSGGDQPETIPNIPDEVTVTYTWGESESFTVTRAIYFRILLDSANFFLADRLGVGEAEVVITSNSIADMITFRRDGKYYSCVLKTKSVSESGEICYVFSTDNYIDGPYLINHSSVESIDFTVYISSDGIRMDSRKVHWDNVAADIDIVDGTYRDCSNSISLTVSEISDFFNFSIASDSPEPDGDIEYIFCGRNPAGDVEIYIVIYEDGSLIYCNEVYMKNREDPTAYSRRGELTYFTREFIVFHYIDPQGKKVICNTELTAGGGFEFMGMRFERRDPLEFDQSEEDTTLRYVTREDSGMKCEIIITNGARYIINDIERGVTIDEGSIRQESDGKSFTLISHPDRGTFEELYITPFDDGSIEYRRIRFYLEDSVN